jgi:hypothetical protein
MSIFKEIKSVGLKDWLWFNIILHRNEFHSSLDIIRHIIYLRIGKYTIDIHRTNIESSEKRYKAHNIDNKLSELKHA